MKMSRRARRMERHHKRNASAGSVALNIVSVIDIFTLLVFFLLINSADVDLPAAHTVRLPESTAEKQPQESAVVVVTDDAILLQGRHIVDTREVLADQNPGIPALTSALEQLAGRRLRGPSAQESGGPDVTIAATRELPYHLMKKVMLACTSARYGQVSFAVVHKSESGG
jgi:biopolymer transport protein ExbD